MALTTLQIVQHLAPGGIETMALDLQQFSQDPDNCYIVSLQGTKEDFCQRWPRLKERADRLIFLDKPEGLSWQTLNQLTEIFKRLNADVVHTHHIGPLLYGGLAARRANVKTIVHTEHDAWHLQSSSKRRLLERTLLKLVKPILVADAKVVAQELVTQLKVPSPMVINNGIDTQRFKPGDKALARRQFSQSNDTVLIGCAARLIDVKGHKILLAAMKNLPEHVHLLLAGQGEEEQNLKQYVAEHLDAKRIHFLGNVEDMPSFYQAIDVFCLPSFKEGYPLSPLEAQSAGVPVVASDIGGMKETLCPDSGRLVPAGDVAALSNALQKTVTQLEDKGCLDQNANLASFMLSEGTEEQYRDTSAAIRTLQQNIRNFVTASNDVRQMAERYHSLNT